MKIEIYKAGHYVNAVENGEELRKWIIANISSGKTGTGCIAKNASFDTCLTIAKEKGFEFKTKLDRIDRILDKADIVEVATEFLDLKKKGENYVFDCPFCKGHAVALISPTFQIYKCFGCGRMGSVIDFVMRFKRTSYEEALRYLEEKYNID